jgi:hypothetical protein
MFVSLLAVSLILSNVFICDAFVTPKLAAVSTTMTNLNLSTSTATATTTALEELSKMTTISIDSGDLDVVEKYAKTGLVTDATTNPLFVSQAGANGDKRYEDMVYDAIMYAKRQKGGGDASLPDFEPEINIAMDKLAVSISNSESFKQLLFSPLFFLYQPTTVPFITYHLLYVLIGESWCRVNETRTWSSIDRS